MSVRITSTPGVQGGEPCIAGTRVRTRTVYRLHRAGWTMQQMRDELPTLSSDEIRAAITYEERRRVESEPERRIITGRELLDCVERWIARSFDMDADEFARACLAGTVSGGHAVELAFLLGFARTMAEDKTPPDPTEVQS